MLKRQPFKAKKSPLKRVALKKKPLAPEKINAKKLLREVDDKFYEGIWNTNEHRSMISKKYLWEPINTCYFHHLLPKGIKKYEKYRHCAWNILMVTPEEHTQIEVDPSRLPIEQYNEFMKKWNKAIDFALKNN